MSILIEEMRGASLVLTLNRPEALNALSSELVQALRDAVGRATSMPEARTVILTGAGRAFSAGTDLKQRQTLSREQKAAQSQLLLTLSEELWDLPMPVIAAVGGWCLGGGAELALACDLRVAADNATFGFPEMTLGAYPGSGGPVTLSRIVGVTRAKDLLFTARRFGAEDAHRFGMVDRVVPAEHLLDEALNWAREMEATAPLALAALKRSLNEGASLSLREAGALDQRLRRPLDATQDNEEGMRAHFEKRRPVFRGR
ncbi:MULTISPECIES: enoyl-CoA hydratase/isomerase family protein [Cupriavidus]|uniref:enoyl-CoA hydratase/isomerase family protein n=1 Tax=Cupriavidus TaxID=106589 RepID=UPI00036CBE7F|nr:MULTISPECIES: enoyl-CoA hydratase/isomerase family protein [Cupriavidus]